MISVMPMKDNLKCPFMWLSSDSEMWTAFPHDTTGLARVLPANSKDFRSGVYICFTARPKSHTRSKGLSTTSQFVTEQTSLYLKTSYGMEPRLCCTPITLSRLTLAFPLKNKVSFTLQKQASSPY